MINKLPTLDKLHSIKGKKEGEIKLFKNNDVPEVFVTKEHWLNLFK